MPSYVEKFKHKKTGQVSNVLCMDNYYGYQQYGYIIVGDKEKYAPSDFLNVEPMRDEEFVEKYEPVYAG